MVKNNHLQGRLINIMKSFCKNEYCTNTFSHSSKTYKTKTNKTNICYHLLKKCKFWSYPKNENEL